MKITIENGEKKIERELKVNKICNMCLFYKINIKNGHYYGYCHLFDKELENHPIEHGMKQCDQCKQELGELE